MKRSTQFAACLFVSLFAVIASAQVSFKPSEYTSGDAATAGVASGDFNQDGILDLVTVNTGTLSFYRGMGGGKFAAPINQTIPANLGEVFAADFNHDGKLDLAIAGNSNGTSSVAILLGNGNGTFTPGMNVVTGGVPYFIALADFNADHRPDLAASYCSGNTCATQVFLGESNGTFKLVSTLTYGGGDVVAGDFNADGRQDLAVIDYNNQVVMFLGNGDGSFQAPLLASEDDPVSLAVGDFYNDRIQSLAIMTGVPDNSGNFEYYISTARYLDGGISVMSPQLVNSSQFYHQIAAGDLNGDYKDDIVVSGGEKFGSGALVAYMLGNGDGTFQPGVSLTGYGQNEGAPFVRDMNLDARHDIGAAWSDGYMMNGGGAYYLQNVNGTAGCIPPKANALSVHICAPRNGETVGQTFTFLAAGNASNGVAKRMELWIDGKKAGQNLEDQLKVTTSLSRGKHTASFVVVDSFDQSVANSVSFTSAY